MEIVEYNVVNNVETMGDENIKAFGCWCDDDSCPSFCDHEWGS